MGKDNFTKLNIKQIIMLVIAVCMIITLGTYAWLSYRSKNTAMVLTIGDINDVEITLSPYQLDLSLTPVLSLDTNGDYVSVTVKNNNTVARNFKLYYDIEEIASGLQNSNFRYTIIRQSDNNTVQGNFASANTTNNFYILDTSIPASTTYNYKVYVWLYGNNPNAQGLAFKGDLRAEIG